MNKSKKIAVSVFLTALSAVFTLSSHATVIATDGLVSIARLPDDPGGLSFSDRLVEVQNPLSSIAFGGGSIDFRDADGNPLVVMDPSTPDWWHAPGNVYTTRTHSIVVSFTNLHVTGLAFNIGATRNVESWIEARYADGAGGTGSLRSDWFSGVRPAHSPGYGVYVSGGNGCASLSSVEIDPAFLWGIGNVSIATGDACSVSVPEPGSLTLMGAGLLGLALVRLARRKRLPNSSLACR